MIPNYKNIHNRFKINGFHLDKEALFQLAYSFIKEGEIFEKEIPFDTPKPVKLVERILEICSNSNSIILDSFAGSGTTAHAVLNLNKQDGGNRKFILIEMEDYAKTTTAERVKLVIEGKSGNSKRGEIIETSFNFNNCVMFKLYVENTGM